MKIMIKRNVKNLGNALVTIYHKAVNGSDYHRWHNTSNLSPEWDLRTIQIAALIPSGSSVLEFGAGRMVLRDNLPEGCTYTPSDIVDRGSNTIICDLNAESLYDFSPHDVVVFSGVLEYINDVPRVVSHISKIARIIIATYAVTDYEPNIIRRRANGWVNDYSLSELESIFLQNLFHSGEIKLWEKQKIIYFSRINCE